MTLEILVSDGLSDVRHGFFTRRGGASSGIFGGLNCGPGSSDQAEAVRINRTRVATAMGGTLDSLISLQQIHSPDVVTLDAIPVERPKADGMVTRHEGLILGILTADCAPVLFADSAAGVIGAAHAGWKGAVGGVLEATVAAMLALGATREGIHATVGPTISQRNYEVGLDFMDDVLAEDGGNTRFFAGGRSDDKVQFDLPSYVVAKLRNTGVTAEWTGHCTYAEPDRFFSFRRTTHRGEVDYGRQIACIRL